jgi:hypothetical protein
MSTLRPTRQVPVQLRLRQSALAVSIVGGPLAFLVGGMLSPTISRDGQTLIAANIKAGEALNITHLWAFVVGSFLLPVSILGLAQLVYRRSPKLAASGAVFGIIGWLPLAALTALDGLIYTMAEQPNGTSYAGLLNAFYGGPMMMTFLVVYIVGHLLTYVLLGIALDRTRAIPRWAAWAIVASSPLTMLMFALPGNPQAAGGVAIGLLVIGSVPAARAVLRSAPE